MLESVTIGLCGLQRLQESASVDESVCVLASHRLLSMERASTRRAHFGQARGVRGHQRIPPQWYLSGAIASHTSHCCQYLAKLFGSFPVRCPNPPLLCCFFCSLFRSDDLDDGLYSEFDRCEASKGSGKGTTAPEEGRKSLQEPSSEAPLAPRPAPACQPSGLQSPLVRAASTTAVSVLPRHHTTRRPQETTAIHVRFLPSGD